MSEALTWREAQDKSEHRVYNQMLVLPTVSGKICHIDGSCKGDSVFSGLGWVDIMLPQMEKFATRSEGTKKPFSFTHRGRNFDLGDEMHVNASRRSPLFS